MALCHLLSYTHYVPFCSLVTSSLHGGLHFECETLDIHTQMTSQKATFRMYSTVKKEKWCHYLEEMNRDVYWIKLLQYYYNSYTIPPHFYPS